MAGGDSDKNEVRFERGLYVGLAAAAAAVGMTVAAYLTAQRIIQMSRYESHISDIENEINKFTANHNIASVPTRVDGGFAWAGKNPTIASLTSSAKGGSVGKRFDEAERDAWHGLVKSD